MVINIFNLHSMLRKVFISIASIFTAVGLMAVTDGVSTVYLNNGNVLRGEVVSNKNGKIEIVTDNGARHTYLMSEVRKIDSAKPIVPPQGQYTPAEGFYDDHSTMDNGFYFAAESNTGVSIRPGSSNLGFEELDLIGGYRVNTYFRLGLGLGARYYWNNEKVRWHGDRDWTMPLFADFRGEFMPRAYRTVTPYWNMQIGANLGDGFMIRPTIGMRIGERRSAFLLALSYTGQSLKGIDKEHYCSEQKFMSFISIKLGYEF